MCALPLTPPGDKGKQQQGRIPVLLEVMLSSSRDNRAITGRHNDGSSGPIYRTSVKPGFVSRDPPRHLNHLLENAYLPKEKLALLNSDLTRTQFASHQLPYRSVLGQRGGMQKDSGTMSRPPGSGSCSASALLPLQASALSARLQPPESHDANYVSVF